MSFNQSKVQRWSGGSWVDCTQVLGFTYVDNLFKPRYVEIQISDPLNTQQGNYSAFQYIRISEKVTEDVLFFGRVTFIDPKYDESMGQMMILVCKDFGVELEGTTCDQDYTLELAGACGTDEVIKEIIKDYTYEPPSYIADGDTGTVTGSPVTIQAQTTQKVVTVTGLGNLTVTLPLGCTGLAESGVCTVNGSPKALVPGVQTIIAQGVVGTILITIYEASGNIRDSDIEASGTDLSGAPSFAGAKPRAWDAIMCLSCKDKRLVGSNYGWVFRTGNGLDFAPALVSNAIYYPAGKYVGTKSGDETLEPITTDVPADGLTIAFRESLGTLADLTGTATGSPVTLKPGANTITVTSLGTFTVTLAAGDTGTAVSGVACLVTGSPLALPAGATVIDTSGPGSVPGTITINVSQQKLDMYGPYEFPSYPKEIITEVFVPYDDAGVYKIYGPDRIVYSAGPPIVYLDEYLGVKRPKTVYTTGAKSLADATTAATAWLIQYGQATSPQKGKIQLSHYPKFVKGGDNYFVNAGHIVHIHHSLLASVDNTNMIVTEVKYSEPECISELQLLSETAGFDAENEDLWSSLSDQTDRSYGVAEMAPVSFDEFTIPAGALHTWTQPFSLSLVWSSNSQDEIAWVTDATAGGYSLVCQDGSTFIINDGHLHVGAIPEYFYVDLTGHTSGQNIGNMLTTTDFRVAIGTGHALCAVAEKGPTTDDKACVLPAGGKHGLLNVGLLTANCVQSDTIMANSVTINKLAMQCVDAQIDNYNFELGNTTGWTEAGGANASVQGTYVIHGSYSLKIPVTLNHHYMYQDIPAVENEIWTAECWFDEWDGVSTIPVVNSRLYIAAIRADGVEITNSYVEVVPAGATVARRQSISLKMPALTKWVRIAPWVSGDGAGGSTTFWVFDDCKLIKSSQIIMQGTPGGTRIELTDSQIAGYNGATRQFYLQASDGKAYCGGGNVLLDTQGVSLAGSGRLNLVAAIGSAALGSLGVVGSTVYFDSNDGSYDLAFGSARDIYLQASDDVIVDGNQMNLYTNSVQLTIRYASGGVPGSTSNSEIVAFKSIGDYYLAWQIPGGALMRTAALVPA